MKAVILAGGMGTRISEETIVKPKPMVNIGEQPILWHIMKLYSAYDITDFVICLGYKGHMIKDYFINYFSHQTDITIDLEKNTIDYSRSKAEPWHISLVDTGRDTLTGGRLKRVKDWVGKEPFLMTYGDGLADVDIDNLIQFHKKGGKKCTVTAVQPPGRFGAMKLTGNEVVDFIEKPAGDNAWINGGFFVLDPSALDLIKDDKSIWEQEPMRELTKMGEMQAFRHMGFWQPMDTIRDRDKLIELWNSGNAPWKVWED